MICTPAALCIALKAGFNETATGHHLRTIITMERGNLDELVADFIDDRSVQVKYGVMYVGLLR